MSTVSYNLVICVNYSVVLLSWNKDKIHLRKIGISFSSNLSCDKLVLRIEKKIEQSDIDIPYFKETASKYAWMDCEAPKGF